MKTSILHPELKKKVANILSKSSENRTKKDLLILATSIRHYSLYMVYSAQSGHPGGPLGLADIFSVLFFKEMNYDIKDVYNSQDILFISNGHTCAVRYAAMCLAGFFSEERLSQFRALGSPLQGHPSTKFLPEVVNSSGSLGQGLSVAGGYALGIQIQKKNQRTLVSMSDGECQEGMTWEAAMSIAHRNVNITAFLDYNNIQIDGYTTNVMNLGDLKGKFDLFGWKTWEIDGHNYDELLEVFQESRSNKYKSQPKMILCRTVLGKGVSFMEDNPGWHGKAPNKEQYEQAIQELN